MLESRGKKSGEDGASLLLEREGPALEQDLAPREEGGEELSWGVAFQSMRGPFFLSGRL